MTESFKKEKKIVCPKCKTLTLIRGYNFRELKFYCEKCQDLFEFAKDSKDLIKTDCGDEDEDN